MPLILLPDVLVDEEAAMAPSEPALLHRYDELSGEAWAGRAGHSPFPGESGSCYSDLVGTLFRLH